MGDGFSHSYEPSQHNDTSAFGRLGENHGEVRFLWIRYAAGRLKDFPYKTECLFSGGVGDKYGKV